MLDDKTVYQKYIDIKTKRNKRTDDSDPYDVLYIALLAP